MTQRSRTWTFTINNPTDDDYKALEALKQSEPSYMIVGKEYGSEGTFHLQCYVRLKNPRGFNGMKKTLPRAHFKRSHGTDEHNRIYCSKDGDFEEYGHVSQQGKRTDIERVRDVVTSNQGAPMRALLEENINLQCVRMAEKYLSYNEVQRNWKTHVSWYYGPTGTGKSRKALEVLQDPYLCNNSNKWWCGYDAHEHVLIDDFRADFCKFHELLRILDRYPYRVEFKGGQRQLLAKKIIITSSHHPIFVYRKSEEDIKQLLRRIEEILEFK